MKIIHELSEMEFNTCLSLAQDNKCDEKTLDELAEHPDAIVRDAVARNRNTTAKTLSKLALDKEWDVR